MRSVTSGVSAPLHLTLSSGEIASTATAIEHPIRLLESGPAAGAMAAAFFGRLGGYAGRALARHGRHDRQSLRDRGRPAGAWRRCWRSPARGAS